tara:strand:- start:5711 stop:7204 length:1494 start_codon:yes stop_codon:yes gene_type:complete
MIKSALLINVFAILDVGIRLITQIVLAKKFGANIEMDAFLAASSFPILMTMVFYGAFNVTFIPVFIEYKNKGNSSEAWAIASIIINIAFIFFGIIALIGIIKSSLLLSCIAPGLSMEVHSLASKLIKILFVSMLFNGISGLFLSVHLAHSRFTLAAILPFVNSLFVFAVVFLFKDNLGIYALVYGILGGAILRAIILMPIFKDNYYLSFNYKHQGVVQVGKLMFPLLLGAMFYKSDMVVDRFIASYLPQGSISYLGYSYKITLLTVAMLGQGFTRTILPALSEKVVNEDWVQVKNIFFKVLMYTLYFTIPTIVGLIVLRIPIIQLLFEGNSFTHEVTVITANTLFFYTGAIIALTVGGIFTSFFYARKDIKTVFLLSFTCMTLNIVFSVVFAHYFNHYGIAMGTSAATCITIILYYRIIMKNFRYSMKGLFSRVSKLIVASLVMGIVIKYILLSFYSINVFVMILLICVGIVSYFIITLVLRVKETQEIKEKIIDFF